VYLKEKSINLSALFVVDGHTLLICFHSFHNLQQFLSPSGKIALQALTILVTVASEKIIWQLNKQVANLVTGAVQKVACSSARFSFVYSLNQMNSTTIFAYLSSLPVSFFFYLLSWTVV